MPLQRELAAQAEPVSVLGNGSVETRTLARPSGWLEPNICFVGGFGDIGVRGSKGKIEPVVASEVRVVERWLLREEIWLVREIVGGEGGASLTDEGGLAT